MQYRLRLKIQPRIWQTQLLEQSTDIPRVIVRCMCLDNGYGIIVNGHTLARHRPYIRIPTVHNRAPGKATQRRISGSKIPPFLLDSHKIDRSLRGAPVKIPINVPINAEIENSPTLDGVKL